MLPPRWQPVREFFDVLLAPLLKSEHAGLFTVEHNGPDGERWTVLRPEYVDLAGDDPALDATRCVARMCRTRSSVPDPGPEEQQRRAVYYAPLALADRRRDDHHAIALAAIVLDIDDRSVGGRAGCVAALSRIPESSFVVTSGGGLQVGYVLNEPLVFDRSDRCALRAGVGAYLRAAHSLGLLSGADATHWPSHLFRCPGAYHLKRPNDPVLVTADVHPGRRFNLEDFDDLASTAPDHVLECALEDLVARLVGEPRPQRTRQITPATPVDGVVRVPRRVSRAMRQLLSVGTHPKYTRSDGTLDRSRATYSAALSLLGAGLDMDRVLGLLAISSLRPAIDDRGGYGEEWLVGQVTKASAYLHRSGVVS